MSSKSYPKLFGGILDTAGFNGAIGIVVTVLRNRESGEAEWSFCTPNESVPQGLAPIRGAVVAHITRQTHRAKRGILGTSWAGVKI
jgi:hypothetical protein